MKQKDNRTLISKKEWVIRLMQGMVGNYGNQNNHSTCYYHGGKFFIHEYDDELYYMNINDIDPAKSFWITDEKGIPNEPLNIINIKEQ